MLKGALHTHSIYSDGEFTLAELRDVYLAAGCAFVCITDHAQYFDAAKLKKYRGECSRLSGEQFVFIPGLEFSCAGKLHVLGYGVTELICNNQPQEVIQRIEGLGGVSVIAHPRDSSFPAIESFSKLPGGIEAWNSKYDGRYAPRPGVFHLLQRLQQREPQLHAFYGQDLHWKKQFRGLLNVVPGDAPNPREILAALASGNYQAVKDGLTLPSDGHIPEALMQRFARIHRRSDTMRALIRGTKKQTDRLGLAVPAAVKSHLRRIF